MGGHIILNPTNKFKTPFLIILKIFTFCTLKYKLGHEVGYASVCVRRYSDKVLFTSIIFIVGFIVVGGLRARNGVIFVSVDFLKHTTSLQLIPSIKPN